MIGAAFLLEHTDVLNVWGWTLPMDLLAPILLLVFLSSVVAAVASAFFVVCAAGKRQPVFGWKRRLLSVFVAAWGFIPVPIAMGLAVV